MINCPNCGELFLENARFCTRCGCSIQTAIEFQNRQGNVKERKRKKKAPLLICIIVFAFVGVSALALFTLTRLNIINLCNHEWSPATCVENEVCTKCGETKGNPLGHLFGKATCTTPSKCSRCGITKGEKLGHTVGIGICSRCGQYSYELRKQASEINTHFTSYLKETTGAFQELMDSYQYLSDTFQQTSIAQGFADYTVNATNELIDITKKVLELQKAGYHSEFDDLMEELKSLLTISEDILKYWDNTYDIYGTRDYMVERFGDITNEIEKVNTIINGWNL